MTNAESAARQVDNSEWLERGVRIGLVAYGIVHLLVAWLALQLAFGDASGTSSSQGAFQQMAQEPFGKPLLWLVAVGFVALGVWQFFDALWGHTKYDGGKRAFKRAGSAGKTVLYFFLAYGAAKTALGEGSSSSKDRMTAKIMDLPFGRGLVGLLGLAIVAIGCYLVSRAVRRSFEHDLQPQATSGTTGSTVVRLGQAGYTAKGVSLAAVGFLFLWAAWTYDPDKAGGLDVALHKLLRETSGPWVLALIALGIGCFGVFCFFWAKDADTSS